MSATGDVLARALCVLDSLRRLSQHAETVGADTKLRLPLQQSLALRQLCGRRIYRQLLEVD